MVTRPKKARRTAERADAGAALEAPSVDDAIRPGSLLEALLAEPVRFVAARDELRAGLSAEAARAAGYIVLGDARAAESAPPAPTYDDAPAQAQAPAQAHARAHAPVTTLYAPRLSLRLPPLGRAAGLYNRGNTCYLNSVMQALLHTPPLAAAMLTQGLPTLLGAFGNPSTSKQALRAAESFNAVAALKTFFEHAWRGGGGAIAPTQFVANLRRIARPLRPGRQEDAHEYLRFLLDALQHACVRFAPERLPPNDPVLATTFVQRIFGGRLRSRVTCLACGHTSDTYDPFGDLSLEVRKGIGSVRQALDAYTAAEALSDKYRCEGCKRRVNATKQFTIDAAPPVLTLHLKRFGVFGNKINRPIAFGESLNIGRYMSEHTSVPYRLYAVVHHFGSGPNVGHYVASVRAPDAQWVRMDDASASRMACPEGDPSAYLLFYVRDPAEAPVKAAAGGRKEPASPAASAARTTPAAPAAPPAADDLGEAVAAPAPAPTKAERRELRRQKKLRAQARRALRR